eukprot:CAMPEP_0118704188 /NCGR_PEP_ID=MMETSP0800-20121206/19070_1 /TAXON_ID=210618 ORGANISM="Striatella unipunctata, Strain CCMP2910" /NCGR_SAMPLE_ID=MMETSP0800 /ASSEMBLY_ACC=CAM_ASM_000638 /LENGTH=281 /DNA_ID=CAMNT_0006605997 /DNA_START=144 /DNA_END=989 /DNA_ORIENTATION=+
MGESGKPLTYRDSTVHRVIPGFVMQGGDFVFGNGTGGESIFNGKKFKDERAGLNMKHDRKGILSMGNSGKNSNSSQFFITFQAAPQCDGKHVVFGEMISGFEVLDTAEGYGTKEGDPTVPIRITDCGIFSHLATPGAGFWYDQPDAESYSGISPVFMVRPRVFVVAPNDNVIERFRGAMGKYSVVNGMAIDFENSSIKQAAETVLKSLYNWGVDVVLVAPVCAAIKDEMTISGFLKGGSDAVSVSLENTILVAKPADAMKALWTKSWMVDDKLRWQIDGRQ